MPAHPATGKFRLQLMYQQPECCPLLRRPGVRRASPAVQTAFVANSDTLRIKSTCVRTDPLDRTGKKRCTVPADIVVLTGTVESTPTVHRVQIKSCQFLVFTGGGTVNHDQTDLSHACCTVHDLLPLYGWVRSFLVASATFVSTAAGFVVFA